MFGTVALILGTVCNIASLCLGFTATKAGGAFLLVAIACYGACTGYGLRSMLGGKQDD